MSYIRFRKCATGRTFGTRPPKEHKTVVRPIAHDSLLCYPWFGGLWSISQNDLGARNCK